jgi:hypothetical protein
MQDLANPSASVHPKRFSTPSLTLKVLCAGNLNRRGLKGSGSPHDVTKCEMLALLRKHYIHTRTVWSADHSKSHRGFYLSQFEQALKPYRRPEAGTSSQARKIIALAKPRRVT